MLTTVYLITFMVLPISVFGTKGVCCLFFSDVNEICEGLPITFVFLSRKRNIDHCLYLVAGEIMMI